MLNAKASRNASRDAGWSRRRRRRRRRCRRYSYLCKIIANVL